MSVQDLDMNFGASGLEVSGLEAASSGAPAPESAGSGAQQADPQPMAQQRLRPQPAPPSVAFGPLPRAETLERGEPIV